MSTSILYHSLGLVGYTYQHTKYKGHAIRFKIEPQRDLYVCPKCGSRHVIKKGKVTREFRASSFGRKFVTLVLDVPRVECKKCGHLGQIEIGFADPGCSYTRELARKVVDLSKKMTIADIAEHVGLGWDTVKRIIKKYLDKKYGRPDLSNLEYLAIDEISVKKGHKYLTLVMNLASGSVIFVGDGKGSEALEPFWEMLGPRRMKRIKAVGIDLGQAYTKAVEENLPDAKIVYDHFHVVKLANDALTDLRRSVHAEATDTKQKAALKGLRWILLKRLEDLDDGRNEQERLQEALDINKPLATAYYLKEDLRQIWEQPCKAQATAVLDEWTRTAEGSRIPQLQRIGQTLKKAREGILNWYDHKISSGPLEGLNNKIKTLKRQAYGFRDMEFFKLRILAIHRARYVFCG